MAQFVFINNFNTVLASAITSTQTTITVTSSTGLPTLALDQVIPLTLLDAATKTVYEIVYVTGISGTTLTVERGQEGTTANAYLAGDLVSCNPTVGTVPPIRASLPYTTTQTLPVGNDIIVYTGTLTADVTFTLPSTGMPVAGRIKVYGSASAFTVTVSLANSTGSPFLHLPDGSEVYSYVLPASASQNFIDLFWDGTNWKAFNGGIMSIPNATSNNQPVALGQMMGPATAGASLGTLAVSTTYTKTITFTAPSDGYVWGQLRTAFNAEAASGGGVGCILIINGTSYQNDNTILPMSEAGVTSVTAGESVTVTAQLTTGSTSPNIDASLYVDAFFIPALSNA